MNSSTNPDLDIYGQKFDVDWFTDTKIFSPTNNSYPAVYSTGKLIWWAVGGTNNVPFWLEGEMNAASANVDGLGYKDIFTQH